MLLCRYLNNKLKNNPARVLQYTLTRKKRFQKAQNNPNALKFHRPYHLGFTDVGHIRDKLSLRRYSKSTQNCIRPYGSQHTAFPHHPIDL